MAVRGIALLLIFANWRNTKIPCFQPRLCLVVLPTGISPERQERTENIEIVNYGVDLWASIAINDLSR